jgi:hypothetical protein
MLWRGLVVVGLEQIKDHPESIWDRNKYCFKTTY